MKQTQDQMFLVEIDSICEHWNKDKLTDEAAVQAILALVRRYQEDA